jgi:hypothetical protein
LGGRRHTGVSKVTHRGNGDALAPTMTMADITVFSQVGPSSWSGSTPSALKSHRRLRSRVRVLCKRLHRYDISLKREIHCQVRAIPVRPTSPSRMIHCVDHTAFSGVAYTARGTPGCRARTWFVATWPQVKLRVRRAYGHHGITTPSQASKQPEPLLQMSTQSRAQRPYVRHAEFFARAVPVELP